MKQTISDSISNKISKGEVKMRSRISVLVEQYGMGGIISLVLFSLTILAGFVLYWVSYNTDLITGTYGAYGLSSFIQSFPYLLLGFFILFFVLLAFLFRRYDFSYKKPFFPILLLVFGAILLFGYLSTGQAVGRKFYQTEGRYFRMGMMNNANAVTGDVLEVRNDLLTIQDEQGKRIRILISPETHFPFGKPEVGDLVRSVGTWNGDTFKALGVRVFDTENPNNLGPGMMRGQGRGKMRSQ